MLGYDRIGETPLVLRRRGASPRRFSEWLLVLGVAMLAGSLALVGGELGSLSFTLMWMGGMFACIGAHSIGTLDATAALIVQQPRQVEVAPTPRGCTVLAARVLLPGEDVRRIELHAVPVADRHGRVDHQGRFVVAIVARTRVVELSFLGGEEEARAVADAVREHLPHLTGVVTRQRPNFRVYSIGGGLVIIGAVVAVTLCCGWAMLLRAHDVVTMLPPLGVVSFVVIALYLAPRWLAPDAIRQMVEVEYGIFP